MASFALPNKRALHPKKGRVPGMILLFLVALLFIPSDAGSPNSFRLHLADPLQLKCDALPYRSVFVETRCYFAVDKEVKFSEASAHCSSIFNGSKVATEVKRIIFNSMMLEKSNFHGGSDSKGIKQIICVQDTGYTCDQGEQSTVLPGKCFERAATRMTFVKAEQYCSRIGMEVPQIDNDLDNQMFRALLIKEPAWIRNVYSGREGQKWKRQRRFSRFGVCDRPSPRIWAGHQMPIVCGWEMSSLVDRTGYWGNDCSYQQGKWDVICMKDADNDFTTGRKPCIANHEWDEETGLCEWTGPKDSCAKLIDFYNKTWFFPMPNFPKETHREIDFMNPHMPHVNDQIVKAVVRRGCMFTGYMHGLGSGLIQENLLVELRHYGEHNVPCHLAGDLDSIHDGLSRVNCYCDPTEANINDHEPAPPPKKKCIQHHVFNETTQSCEWIHEPQFCGELITYDGRRKMIEIPNWPKTRKYDADHWNNATLRAEDFHSKITDVIVRQHCWFTMLQWGLESRQTLRPSGYGKHQVASHYNGLLGAEHDGTHRVICQCFR